MKKVLFVFAIATSLVACNNADTNKATGEDTAAKKDTAAVAPVAPDTTHKDTTSAAPKLDTPKAPKADTTAKAHK